MKILAENGLNSRRQREREDLENNSDSPTSSNEVNNNEVLDRERLLESSKPVGVKLAGPEDDN